MRGLFYIVLVLSAFGARAQEKETVRSVSLELEGGRAMYEARYFIDKDTTAYKMVYKGKRNSKPVTTVKSTVNWWGLVKQIDIVAFKAVREGESESAYDGMDKTIVIETDRGEYRKRNGGRSGYWNQLYWEITGRFEEKKEQY